MPVLGAILATALASGAGGPSGPGDEDLPAFSWDAPASADCPSEGEVRARLAERLAAAPGDPPRAEVAAVARVREVDGGFELRLWTAEAGRLRERTLTDRTCTVLADAAVLLVALAIHPAAEAGDPRVADVAASAEEVASPTPPPEPVAPPTARGRGRPSAPAAPASGRPGRRRVEGLVGVGVGVAAGALPGVGPVVRIAGGPSFRLRSRLSIRLSVPLTYEIERRGRFSDRPDAGADLHLVATGVLACAVGRPGPVRLPGCAGLEAGAIVGRGVGVEAPRTDAVAWVAVPVSFGVGVEVGRFVLLSGTLEGVFPVARTVFVVEGLGDVFRPAPAAVRAFAEVAVRW